MATENMARRIWSRKKWPRKKWPCTKLAKENLAKKKRAMERMSKEKIMKERMAKEKIAQEKWSFYILNWSNLSHIIRVFSALTEQNEVNLNNLGEISPKFNLKSELLIDFKVFFIYFFIVA